MAVVTVVKKTLISIFLVGLTGWLLYYSWLERQIHYEDYRFTAEEANRLRSFPEAQHAYGMQALYRQDAETAADFFRQSVSQDILFMNGWLKLAEVEASAYNLKKARAILSFTDSFTANVFRWKWSQTLLAHDLKMEDIFLRNINYLIAHGKLVQDALQLLETHFKRNTNAALRGLHHENLAPYLKWLMRWGRADDAAEVWERMAETNKPDSRIMLEFVHFLVNKKRIQEAQAVWPPHTDKKFVTNAGFEEEITRRAFDWRYGIDRDRRWKIKRVETPTFEGSFSLEVSFAGRENVSFHNLYQIVPVDSMMTYKLTYWWRSEDITTDQGPFLDIYGYDEKGLYKKGPMITGTNAWRSEAIQFTTPENCQAVVVRLRRSPSHRFDRNIAGTLWLDNFLLETTPSQMQKIQ